MNIQIGDIGHIIQLAIAPVFLLTGIGTMLVVLTNRLGASSTARACWKTGSTSVTTISIWMS
jgi:type IV secretory pathway VirB6-like protein